MTQKQILYIAMMCHEANRQYCASIGDNTQPSWADAPEWQKGSAVNGVKHRLENPLSTPEDSHKSWLNEKTLDGWKYGEVKNPETKEHPCFCDYSQLSESQRKKDEIFIATVDKCCYDIQQGNVLTLGEFRVGIGFNVGGHPDVEKAKRAAADYIDIMEEVRDSLVEKYKGSPILHEVHRLVSHSQTLVEDSAMNAVKAITKRLGGITIIK